MRESHNCEKEVIGKILHLMDNKKDRSAVMESWFGSSSTKSKLKYSFETFFKPLLTPTQSVLNDQNIKTQRVCRF
ncbi:MAG: hypothetical protein Q4F57_09915 [Weeksellaceae bacterium]|nr:hypothetical protein [Weeksellaceae bacterium]